MAALTVLLAPDSFKGSLSSVEVAQALADGWRRARPGDRIEAAPLADGGDGTLEAVAAAGGWEWRETRVPDPIGREVSARWLQSADGSRGLVELADASGLWRVAGELAPFESTTEGTGEVLRAVLEAGVRKIVLGIGGSATTDGGAGMLHALGGRFDGFRGPIDLAGLDARLGEVELRVACDVTNPLLGARGAAATYGPQKGAAPDDVPVLDERLERWADALEAATGRRERETPGAGAAGGVGFALLAIRDRLRRFDLVPGVQLVMEETRFLDRLAAADLVITGEGRIDEQTAFGKTAAGVARAAGAAGVACVAFGGSVTGAGAACLAELGCVAIPVVEAPVSLEDAMRDAAALVANAAERVARLLDLSASVGVRSVSNGGGQ